MEFDHMQATPVGTNEPCCRDQRRILGVNRAGIARMELEA
jgi:hypothetical protein